MQQSLDLDGHCNGPLFQPLRVRRLSKRAERNESGGAEVWRKYRRARPSWASPADCMRFWSQSQAMTAATGVQHSVDHIVPLVHPMVCGLHCPDNMRVIPLAMNQAKSNNWWPDMWGEQIPLLD